MTLFYQLVEASARVGSTPSRRSKTAELAQLLRRLDAEEIDIGVAYLAGETRQGRTGIGYALIQSAQVGAADEPRLELRDVDGTLAAIAQTTGPGSAAQRRHLLRGLFAAATGPEQSFLTRLLLGELRQGSLDGLMVDAVAAAAAIPVAEVRRAAMIAGGIASIATTALTRGIDGLRAFSLAVFQPVAPMLAQPVDDIVEALAKIPVASVEWKLDGARVQVHKSGAEVRVFSRTGKELTTETVEIVEGVRQLDADVLILDGEVIAHKSDGTPFPFQDTMRRFGRVQDVSRVREAMPLSVFFFDCLRLNDDDLTGRPGHERFEALFRVTGRSSTIPRLVTSDIKTAQAFYDDAVARMHEGVMVKALDAPYEPGCRSASWLKVKRAHTLDLVVIAAEWGHGRRKGWLSNLHLAARDPATNSFVMLGKTFKGMTDATLKWQTEALLARAVGRDEWSVRVRPELVVEVMFNDLQTSSRYPAGLALRFARIKGYRIDKTPDQADTIDTVRAIHENQSAPHSADA
ncbi:MAG: ATP-dependent DNA ligase [Burkholderiaceae bacterium]|nr:ATP-dependent DNA ligase [Burkholderiaceae bacterium]